MHHIIASTKLRKEYLDFYTKYFQYVPVVEEVPAKKSKKKRKKKGKKEVESNSTNEGSELNNEEIDLHALFDQEEEEPDLSDCVHKIILNVHAYIAYESSKQFKIKIKPPKPKEAKVEVIADVVEKKKPKESITIIVPDHKTKYTKKSKVTPNKQYEEAVKMFSILTGVADTTRETKKEVKKEVAPEPQSPDKQLISILTKNYVLQENLQYSVYRIKNREAAEHMDSEITKYIFQLDKEMMSMDSIRMECFISLQKSLFNYYEGKYNIQALVYGSVSTGLALEGSDMDIAFSGVPISTRDDLLKEIANIKEYLEMSMHEITSIKPIYSSKVPILKLVIKSDQGDIKIDMLITSGYGEGSLYMRCFSSVEMIKDIMSKFRHTREIVILLKKLLSLKQYNSTYKGGLSSYSLVLMVSSFLNQFQHIDSIVEKMINIMLFYGSLEVGRTGISPLLTYFSLTNAPCLTIVDPLCYSNNVAEASFSFGEIQKYMQLLSSNIICMAESNKCKAFSSLLLEHED